MYLQPETNAESRNLKFFSLFEAFLSCSNGNPHQYSCLENPMDGGAWWAAVHGVSKRWTRLSDFTFTFHFHALEKEMATHSSVLTWRIPGTGEPGGLPSMGSHRVGHDWSDLAAAAAYKWKAPSFPLLFPWPSSWNKNVLVVSLTVVVTCDLWAISGCTDVVNGSRPTHWEFSEICARL